MSGGGCPLAGTEANSIPQNSPRRGFLAGLWQHGLLLEAFQGSPDGGVQGGG